MMKMAFFATAAVALLASVCLAFPGHQLPIDFPPVPVPLINPCRPGGGTSPGRECFLDNSEVPPGPPLGARQCVQYCAPKPGTKASVELCTDPLPTECLAPYVPPSIACSCTGQDYIVSAVATPEQVRCYSPCTCVDGDYESATFLDCEQCRLAGQPVPSGCWCDPHFNTLYGSKLYDFMGMINTVFNVISDPTFQMNILFVPASRHSDILAKRESWVGPANVTRNTWLGVVGFQTGHDQISMDAETCIPYFNGEDVQNMRGGSDAIRFSHSMIGEFAEAKGHLTIETAHWQIAVACKWKIRSETKEQRYLNMEVIYDEVGTDRIPEGVLGQTAAKKTYKPVSHAKQGEGVIKGTWKDYIVHENDVFGTDYIYNQFNADNEPDQMFFV